ncbi:MAG: CopG family transcriptional regulator [Gemmatimonadota bacterium]|nr:CopG family transcriptional regulator [Gemmatimonadota bacterium]
MRKPKQEIVTFKVDDALWDKLREIPNRSEFIRSAILGALDGLCPLCRGTGNISPRQKEHLETFFADHSMEECGQCHEINLVCQVKDRGGKQG